MTRCSKKEVITEEEFSLLKGLVDREFGISLKGDKRLTLHTKVSHRLSILGLANYREYYEYILSDSSKEELFTLASHITNNETYFFRERVQLDMFAELLKTIKKERQQKNEKTVKILSLASSSGEEAYSINILIQESGLFLWDWDIKITGIDIDRHALIKAREGWYTKNSFRALNGDAGSIDRYFTKEGDRFIIRRSLTRNVEFRHGNILDRGAFAGLEDMDAIFCRNVFIYMTDDAIDRIIMNLYNSLSDTGYLFIGSSESLIQRTNLFAPEYNGGVIVYRKNI